MPYKYLTDAYRNIDGIRYEQWSDVEDGFPQEIKALKADGRKYRIIKSPDGSRRLFREVLAEDGEQNEGV